MLLKAAEEGRESWVSPALGLEETQAESPAGSTLCHIGGDCHASCKCWPFHRHSVLTKCNEADGWFPLKAEQSTSLLITWQDFNWSVLTATKKIDSSPPRLTVNRQFQQDSRYSFFSQIWQSPNKPAASIGMGELGARDLLQETIRWSKQFPAAKFQTMSGRWCLNCLAFSQIFGISNIRPEVQDESMLSRRSQ